jgi:hypothetical protein
VPKKAKPVDKARPPHARSRVTNGTSLFSDRAVDGRSVWARRFQDLYSLHVADLGGHDKLTEAQRSLVRRAAYLQIELEKIEDAMARGEEGAISNYLPATNALQRIYDTLGVKNPDRAKASQEPTLAEILKGHQAKSAKAPPGQDLVEAAE